MHCSLQLVEYINSLLRQKQKNYTPDFFKQNSISDIDNENPTISDIKERIKQIQEFKAPDFKEIAEGTKSELIQERNMSNLVIEQILTTIFHQQQFDLFINYPYQSITPTYDQFIPYKNCFLQIIIRFYQNIKNKIELSDENNIDYLLQPDLKAREPILQILQSHEKQLSQQAIKNFVMNNSIEKIYEKYLQSIIPSNLKIKPYYYLDEITGDLLNIGCNCVFFNALNESYLKIGQNLLTMVVNQFKHYAFPAFYTYELGDKSINNITFIIKDQKKNKENSQTSKSDEQLLVSTIMPQLQDTQPIVSNIIDTSMVLPEIKIINQQQSPQQSSLSILREKLQKMGPDNCMYQQFDIPQKLKNNQLELMTENEIQEAISFVNQFDL